MFFLSYDKPGGFIQKKNIALGYSFLYKTIFTRKRAMAICQNAGFVPEILFELDQQMTSYHITCSGMGISFVSDTLISQMPENPRVVYYKLEGKDSQRNLSFY